MDNNKSSDIGFKIFAIVMVIVAVYVCYVISNSTHSKGCTYKYEKCISSHTETTHKYWGKMWHDVEYEVCDDWETITHNCDCITYHWFWGDVKTN